MCVMSNPFMSPMRGMIGLALVAVLLLGCGESSCAAEDEVGAVVGQPFRIVLSAAIGSTGYSWSPQFDKAYLKLENSWYEKPDSQLLGASGKQVFVFLPLLPGESTIKMQLKRPWESAPVDSKVYRVSISSKEQGS